LCRRRIQAQPWAFLKTQQASPIVTAQPPSARDAAVASPCRSSPPLTIADVVALIIEQNCSSCKTEKMRRRDRKLKKDEKTKGKEKRETEEMESEENEKKRKQE
jgi:hypothetical protein